MTVSTLGPISPADVHAVLARHTLADGYDLVLDFEKSHGAWLHDPRSGREYLDFCMFFASNPIGYNHPKMKDPEFLEVLHRVAHLKPALSDLWAPVPARLDSRAKQGNRPAIVSAARRRGDDGTMSGAAGVRGNPGGSAIAASLSALDACSSRPTPTRRPGLRS